MATVQYMPDPFIVEYNSRSITSITIHGKTLEKQHFLHLLLASGRVIENNLKSQLKIEH